MTIKTKGKHRDRGNYLRDEIFSQRNCLDNSFFLVECRPYVWSLNLSILFSTLVMELCKEYSIKYYVSWMS